MITLIMKKNYKSRYFIDKQVQRLKFLLILIFLFIVFLPFYLSTCLLYAEISADTKASDSYDISAKSKKEKVSYYISKGNEYLMQGEYSNAIECYNKAKQLKRKDHKIHLLLGEAYRLADMKDESIQAYNESLRKGSEDIRIYLGLGNIYTLKYLYEESKRYYQKALEINKNNITALRGLAEIYENISRYEDAFLLYEKIYSVDSSHEMKLKIVFLNILLGKYDNAEKYPENTSQFKILSGYINLKKNPKYAISEFASTEDNILKVIAYIEAKDMINAKKYLEILKNQSENTLSKKLAVALYENIK